MINKSMSRLFVTPKTVISFPVPTPNFSIASSARRHKSVSKLSGTDLNQQIDIKLVSRR